MASIFPVTWGRSALRAEERAEGTEESRSQPGPGAHSPELSVTSLSSLGTDQELSAVRKNRQVIEFCRGVSPENNVLQAQGEAALTKCEGNASQEPNSSCPSIFLPLRAYTERLTHELALLLAEIGVGITGFGVFFILFGILLYFDSVLLAFGNVSPQALGTAPGWPGGSAPSSFRS